MARRLVARIAAAVVVCAASAFAQYPGGTTMPGMGTGGTPAYTAPSGGYKSSTGIAIGAAAAAGIGVGYFVMHSRAGLSGCLVSRDNGQMELVGKKPANTYVLHYNSSVSLQPGERVRLRGKKLRDGSGQNMFEVHGLAKDYGACS
jgi:hypothetical protein